MKSFGGISNTKKKSTLVVQQLLSALSSDMYCPGDKLPPERVLAEKMECSRSCIREALKALEILGLIESKAGDGTYILPGISEDKELLQGLFSGKVAHDLFDVWEACAEIEAVVTKLAAKSATQKAIERMKSYLNEMRAMLEARNSKGYLDANRDFHLALARGADNPLLESIMRPLIRVTNNDSLLNNALLEDSSQSHLLKRLQESFSEHEKVLHAIQQRDEEAAVRAMREHYKKVRQFYGQKLW